MKKSTIILFILATVFAGTTAYFAFQNRDILSDNSRIEQELNKQKEVRQEIYDLNAKNKTAELELSQLKEKNLKIEKELATTTDQVFKQQKTLEDTEKKLAEQQKIVSENEKITKSSQETAEKDKATIEELKKKLAAENKRTEELNGEIVKLRSTTVLAEKEKTIADISQERETLTQDLAACKLEIASLKQRLQTQLSNTNDRAAVADSRVDEMKSELETAQKKITNLEQTIRTLRQRLANR